MKKIKLLSEVVANQIAAGEVVERPLSVVKELVENALDAGASDVEIHIENGGVDLMRVIDNGSGMLKDDAELCIERYATSKLSEASDLEAIRSYGFRGEALASIASVSKMILLTKTEDCSVGTYIELEQGKVLQKGPKSAMRGTRVEIRDLFFNVPARRKFLKTARSEAAYIEQLVRSLLLINPRVGFKLRVDGKEILNAQGLQEGVELSDKRSIERAILSLGEPTRSHLYAFQNESDGIRISGYLASPLKTRRDYKGMQIFVNQRLVEDKQLYQAIKVAYRTLLEVGRNPICAIDVIIDPREVDVNVHPQKREVRFLDPRKVQGKIIRMMGDFLAATPWLVQKPVMTGSPSFAPMPDPMPLAFRASVPAPASLSPNMSMSGMRLTEKIRALTTDRGDILGVKPQPGHQGVQIFSELKVVGQVGTTFLVLSSHEAMVVIDQHAAHERVVFEKLRKAVFANSVEIQPLLFPVQIELSAGEMAGLVENYEKLLPYGLLVEPFGERHALVKGLPVLLDERKTERIIRDVLINLLETSRPDSLNELQDQVCARMACHGSIRAGQTMQIVEIEELLRELDAIDFGAHCPHGRPVVRSVPFGEMAKWFDRH